MPNKISRIEPDLMEPTIPLGIALLILFGVAIATILALLTLEVWLPGLSLSLFGPQPKAYWDLARSSGIVAYLLMWLSVAFGLIITNKMARVWPGGPTAFDLHQFTSLLGLAFALFHAIVLLGDQFIKYTPLQLLVPFGSVNYQQFWVGFGQLSFYALIPITFSFYVRRQIGTGAWRAIHYGSFLAFSMITAHALLAGSDSANWVMLGIYAMTGGSVMFLTLYRMLGLTGALA
jgi:predicted ferric reductase